MRALICDEYGGIDALRVAEMPDPAPIPGTAMVSVRAAAVNFADVLVVAGQYQAKPELPFVPGGELAGVVESADGLEGFGPGDRVCGFTGFGAMAERAVAYPGSIIRLPDPVSFEAGAAIPGAYGPPHQVSFEAGAAIPVAYGTSYHALVDRARLEEGETLLVLGAAGGVGVAAVQIAKAMGATVVAAVSSEEKAAATMGAGAECR